jgi:hypothetical protein
MKLLVLFISLFLTSVCVATEPAAKTITPGDNLMVDGIPSISADLPEQVGRYTEFRTASFQDWNPTKPEMLITTRFGDTNQVHRLIRPGGARTQLTFFPDRIAGATFEPTSGSYFIFSKSIGGNEFDQNFRYDLATGDITLLTDGKSKNSAPVWSKKGDRVAYTSTRRDGADTDLYLESPNDLKTDRLLAEVKGGGWSIEDWSPDDRQLIVIEGISINESYLWLFDTTTGVRKELTPRPPEGAEKVAYSQARFTKDGKGVFNRSRVGVSTARVRRSGNWQTHLSFAEHKMGRGRLGFERGWKTNRVHAQREWREHAAHCRSCDAQRRSIGRRIPSTSVQPAPQEYRDLGSALASPFEYQSARV